MGIISIKMPVKTIKLETLEEAVDSFSYAISYFCKNPDDKKKAEAYYYRGLSRYKIGMKCEKNQMFKETRGKFYEASNDFEESLRLIKKIIKSLGENARAQTSYSSHENSYSSHENYELWEKYLECYEHLLDESPTKLNPCSTKLDIWYYNKGVVHTSMAKIFAKLAKHEESYIQYINTLESFDKCTTFTNGLGKINIVCFRAWYNKGNVYLKLKQYNKAVNAFQQAYQQCEKSVECTERYLAKYNEGNALYILGKYEEAINEYEEIIKVKQENGNEKVNSILRYKSYNNKGLALCKQEKYGEAIEAFNDAFNIENDKKLNLADAWTNRGIVFYELDIFSEAKISFEEALKKNPGNALASNNLGVILAIEGELDLAKKLFENVVQENPDFLLGKANLAELLLNSGGIEEASRKIKDILEAEKNSDYDMGYIYFLDGRIKIEEIEIKEKKYSEAAKSFEKAASYDVENPTFLLWSVYAKYLCQKFEACQKIPTHEESKSTSVNIQSKTEDARANEIYNLIVSDLEKVLGFCKKRAILKNSFSELINQDISLQATLLFCTTTFLIISLILGIKLLQLIGEFLGVEELVTLILNTSALILGPPVVFIITISIILNIIKITKAERKTNKGLDGLLAKTNTLLQAVLILLSVIFMTILIDLEIKYLYFTAELVRVPELLGSRLNIFLLLLSFLLSILLIRLILLYTDTLKGFEVASFETVGSKTEEKILLNLTQLGIKIFHLESISNSTRLTLKSIVNEEGFKSKNNGNSNTLEDSELKHIIEIKSQLAKFDRYKEIRAYTLYLLGYFYFKLQDYTTAKEKLQECISLKPDERTDRSARDLLDSIWKNKIKPPFWIYWFNSPVKTWRRRAFGMLITILILSILFVHLENPQPIALNGSTSNNIESFIPDQINFYPYIISYPLSNTSSGSQDRDNVNNITSTWNILTPARVNIYPDIPDNYFDAILLLILILILISPSVRIVENVKLIFKKGADVSLDLGPIAAPPEFNFELSPSLMQDVIRRLDENL